MAGFHFSPTLQGQGEGRRRSWQPSYTTAKNHQAFCQSSPSMVTSTSSLYLQHLTRFATSRCPCAYQLVTDTVCPWTTTGHNNIGVLEWWLFGVAALCSMTRMPQYLVTNKLTKKRQLVASDAQTLNKSQMATREPNQEQQHGELHGEFCV